jgi:tRNA dimethylallyltransferase
MTQSAQASHLPPLVAIVGPTAVGKSACAISLAMGANGEIVSADSRLLYRGMNIGTAKPSAEDRRLVRHHLIDVADPRDTWSLARYRQAALKAIADVQQRAKLPILVGGTGQYVRALLQGWAPLPGTTDAELRARWQGVLEQVGGQRLHAMLAEVDPISAAEIDPRNTRRVLRALEVAQLTGRSASAQRSRKPVPFSALVLGLTLPRQELYSRIDERVDRMFAEGLVDEVQGLLRAGVPPEAPSLSAIGYAQVLAYLRGDVGLSECVVEVKRATRVLVRRQHAWFRPSDPTILWFEAEPGVAETMGRVVRAWLHESGTQGRAGSSGISPHPGK